MFPETRNVGISYCRLLLHDTMLRDDSHRTGTADTPVCRLLLHDTMLRDDSHRTGTADTPCYVMILIVRVLLIHRAT